MNIFTSIGLVAFVVAALRMAYIVVAAINPEFVVQTMHRAISLLPGTLSSRTRKMWWVYLAKNCSPERPCLQCAREEQWQRRAQ